MFLVWHGSIQWEDLRCPWKNFTFPLSARTKDPALLLSESQNSYSWPCHWVDRSELPVPTFLPDRWFPSDSAHHLFRRSHPWVQKWVAVLQQCWMGVTEAMDFFPKMRLELKTPFMSQLTKPLSHCISRKYADSHFLGTAHRSFQQSHYSEVYNTACAHI